MSDGHGHRGCVAVKVAVAATGGGAEDLRDFSDGKGTVSATNVMCGAAPYLRPGWMSERGVNNRHQQSSIILDTLKVLFCRCVYACTVNSAKSQLI